MWKHSIENLKVLKKICLVIFAEKVDYFIQLPSLN